MHEALIQLGVINLDFSIDSDGIPTLIEANINGGSMWLMVKVSLRRKHLRYCVGLPKKFPFEQHITQIEEKNYIFVF